MVTTVGESATRTHNCERTFWLSAEKEETFIPLCRFRLLLRLCVEVIEDALPAVRIINHPIQCAEDFPGVDLGVVRKERANVTQAHGDIRIAIVPRKDQTAKAREGNMRCDIADSAVNAQMRVSNLHGGLVRVAFGISDRRPCALLIYMRMRAHMSKADRTQDERIKGLSIWEAPSVTLRGCSPYL